MIVSSDLRLVNSENFIAKEGDTFMKNTSNYHRKAIGNLFNNAEFIKLRYLALTYSKISHKKNSLKSLQFKINSQEGVIC